MNLTKELTSPKIQPTDFTPMLVRLLADQYLLGLQTLHCFWHLRQRTPQGMHSYLEWQFDKLSELMEEVMKNIDQIGEVRIKDSSDFLGLARLKDPVEQDGETEEMLRELLHNHTRLIEWLDQDRQSIPNKTGDHYVFLSGIREHHVFMTWMIRVFLA